MINLPSQDHVTQVDRLALTTGSNPVPAKEQSWRYEHGPDKFGRVGGSSREGWIERYWEVEVKSEGGAPLRFGVMVSIVEGSRV